MKERIAQNEHNASAHNIAHAENIVRESLSFWGLRDSSDIELLNISENLTWLISDAGDNRVLRLHRRGYHSRRAIESELLWTAALRAAGVVRTPMALGGVSGDYICEYVAGDYRQFMTLFEFIDGSHMDESEDLVARFAELGAIAARLHEHAISWSLPDGFTRHAWNLDTIFGAGALWGDWREAPHVTREVGAILQHAENSLTRQLLSYGMSENRYGLLHADMRLANLLVTNAGENNGNVSDSVWVIDFDDCGFGWFMYDFAAAVSFIEDSPQLPAMKQSWLQGYRSVRSLSAADEAIMDSLVMLRRLALLAWIGSHREATEAQALAPHFAEVSAMLAENYLNENT